MFGRVGTLASIQGLQLYSYLSGLKGSKANTRILTAMTRDAEVIRRWLAQTIDHAFLDAAITYYREASAVAELSDLAGLSDVSVSSRKSKKRKG
jgi:hypothetical protein